MKFSIVVLTLNSADFIVPCLESIAAQSFSDFEVVIQDAFSTDETVNLVNSFKIQFPSLKLNVYQFRDSGVYDAMNIALENSSGEWIYFLGSDDRLFSDKTLELVSNRLSSNIEVLYGNVISPHFGGRYNGKFTIEKIFSQNICHQSLFVHRSVFKKHGKFNTKFTVAADWDHNLRWFLDSTIEVVYVDSIIAFYGESGLSSKTPDYSFEDAKPFNFLAYGPTSIPLSYKLKIFWYAFRMAVRQKKVISLVRCCLVLPSLFRPSYSVRRYHP